MLQTFIRGQDFLTVLSQSEDTGLFMYDMHLQICEWNQCMEYITGIERNSSMAKSIFAIFPFLNVEKDTPTLLKALMGDCFVMNNQPLLSEELSGIIRHFNLTYLPFCNDDNTVERAIVMVNEVKEEHTQVLMRQVATMRTLRAFLKFAPMPVYIVDRSFKIKLASESFNQYINSKNSVGQKLDSVLSGDSAEHLKERIGKVLETEKPDILNETFELNGQKRYFHTIRFPIRNAWSEVDAVGGYSIDITDRVKQEQKINALLDHTISLKDKLEHQNQELIENRKSLEQTNQQLRYQKQELEKTLQELSDRNYELDQIMYKTSHDLRSPLTSIMGLLSLARNEQDMDKLPEYHNYIEDRVLKLDNFVKSMLTYAKTSRTEIKAEIIDWDLLIEDSLNNLEYLNNYPHIHIERKKGKIEENSFQSDLLCMKVIFNNLIGNAIKYADLQKERPCIRIHVESYDGKATIRIIDNGIGIEAQYLDKIGRMFFRATEKSEGSGLGMYIVKQAVEKLGGTFHISSVQGEGTAIEVRLPSHENAIAPESGKR